MQCRVSETLEKEGTNPCPSGLGVLFGSHNWCFDIGLFLSIFNQQIPASCPGVILHLQGTCSESFAEHLPFTFTPFQTPMLLFVKAQNPTGPLRCVPISSPSYACHCSAWPAKHLPFCLSLLTSFLSVNTHPPMLISAAPLFLSAS